MISVWFDFCWMAKVWFVHLHQNIWIDIKYSTTVFHCKFKPDLCRRRMLSYSMTSNSIFGEHHLWPIKMVILHNSRMQSILNKSQNIETKTSKQTPLDTFVIFQYADLRCMLICHFGHRMFHIKGSAVYFPSSKITLNALIWVYWFHTKT